MSAPGRIRRARPSGRFDPVPPDPLLALWQRHMRAGDFEAAWRMSDALLRTPRARHAAPPHLRSVWRGGPLTGRRVLVRCHHGLGDTIQFVRYLPLLQEIAREVLFAPQEVLAPLLRCARGCTDAHTRIIAPAETECGGYDVDVEIMELAHVFRTTLDTIPADVPYLHLDPIRPVARDRPAVGLVWQAGDWDPHRSVPPELLLPLAHLPGIRLHLLQRGRALRQWPRGLGIDVGSDDPLTAARIICGLDLVISVDTMVAHLAGALGTPVWLLLRARCDWRWLQHRSDSPWYPGMRLFRQQREGEWRPVLDDVARKLHEFARQHSLRCA